MNILRQSLHLLPRSLTLPLLAEIRARRDEPQLRLVACLGRRDRAFIDVGANIGLYTYVAGKHFRNVYAVEPHPLCAQTLRRTFGNQVSVLECALSERAGSLSLFVPTRAGREIRTRASLEPAANAGFTQQSCSVQVQRLDDLTLHDIGMIKIDVEGHELSVLRGAVNTITIQQPCLLVEIEERHHPGHSDDVIQFVEALEYQGYFIMGHRLHDIAGFSFERYQSAADMKSPDGARSAGYVNNFLFLPGSGDHLARLRQAGFL